MSTNREQPLKRLNQDDPALKELGERSISPERLQRNQDAIDAAIRALPPTHASVSWGKTVGLVLIGGLVATSIWFGQVQMHEDTAPAPNPSTQVTHDKLGTPDAPQPKPKSSLQPQPAQSAYDHRKVVDAPPPSEDKGKFKRAEKAPLRAPARSLKKMPTQPSAPEPTLGTEIAHFEAAQTYFNNQSYDKANESLRQLQTKYPNHKLGPEVAFLQIRNDLAMNQVESALTRLEALLSNADVRPQARWYKLLGDIQKRRDECGAAVIAYSKALKVGLGPRQTAEVRQAVQSCSQTQ